MTASSTGRPVSNVSFIKSCLGLRLALYYTTDVHCRQPQDLVARSDKTLKDLLKTSAAPKRVVGRGRAATEAPKNDLEEFKASPTPLSSLQCTLAWLGDRFCWTTPISLLLQPTLSSLEALLSSSYARHGTSRRSKLPQSESSILPSCACVHSHSTTRPGRQRSTVGLPSRTPSSLKGLFWSFRQSCRHSLPSSAGFDRS